MTDYYLGLYVGASLEEFESKTIPSDGYETLLEVLTKKYRMDAVVTNESTVGGVEDLFLGWEVVLLNPNHLGEIISSLAKSFQKDFRFYPKVFVGSILY